MAILYFVYCCIYLLNMTTLRKFSDISYQFELEDVNRLRLDKAKLTGKVRDYNCNQGKHVGQKKQVKEDVL
ncbi:hypothetical protein KFK09_017385 [Dendrobium nobile]|uniref:Uncharacterized protein n=1 Tax=Dendrobium nobile TaxID=94219 RepID=A0A8T3B787_DENNO|nr:hypothetical protein KFK09_017385 [Dendrobium nobile]